MVTSNHFIIVMLQIIKTYQTKIKNETWLSLFLISLFLTILPSYYLTILLSYQRQSLVILKPNFSNQAFLKMLRSNTDLHHHHTPQ